MKDKPLIMVVDDEYSNVRLLESFLLPQGYTVVDAYDGGEALQLLAKEAIDLIFLDIVMPNLSGFDVLKVIKKSKRNKFIPVVLLTALASREDRIKGLEMGADDFITKPFDASALLARTRSLLRIKFLYDRLQQSYEDLKRSEESKELLTNMIVHDLRNPLMVMNSSLELMSMELKDHFSPDDIIAPVNVLRACRRMQRLIDNILDICKMEDGNLRLEYGPVHIPSLFSELINDYKGETLARSARIRSHAEDDVPQITADLNVIARVLENLISNAFKNIDDNGEIWLNAVFDKATDTVHISVTDNGCGIPQEYLDKIFDKYEQVRLKKQGITHDSGLGLTFCKMAVNAHGGRIWAESEPGKGSAFTFSLPVGAEES